MSAWISAGERARLYARTSSIRPLNHSGHTELPPILSGSFEVVIGPVTAASSRLRR